MSVAKRTPQGSGCREPNYLRRTAAGPIPQTLKLHFADSRHLLIADKGGGSYAVPLPATRFDVLLINPGGRDTRRELLEELHARPARDHQKTTVTPPTNKASSTAT